MSISDYWLDAELYHIEFISNDGRRLDRDLIVPLNMDGEAVRHLFHKSFSNIKEIKSLDSVTDVFCVKEFPELVHSQKNK